MDFCIITNEHTVIASLIDRKAKSHSKGKNTVSI